MADIDDLVTIVDDVVGTKNNNLQREEVREQLVKSVHEYQNFVFAEVQKKLAKYNIDNLKDIKETMLADRAEFEGRVYEITGGKDGKPLNIKMHDEAGNVFQASLGENHSSVVIEETDGSRLMAQVNHKTNDESYSLYDAQTAKSTTISKNNDGSVYMSIEDENSRTVGKMEPHGNGESFSLKTYVDNEPESTLKMQTYKDNVKVTQVNYEGNQNPQSVSMLEVDDKKLGYLHIDTAENDISTLYVDDKNRVSSHEYIKYDKHGELLDENMPFMTDKNQANNWLHDRVEKHWKDEEKVLDSEYKKERKEAENKQERKELKEEYKQARQELKEEYQQYQEELIELNQSTHVKYEKNGGEIIVESGSADDYDGFVARFDKEGNVFLDEAKTKNLLEQNTRDELKKELKGAADSEERKELLRDWEKDIYDRVGERSQEFSENDVSNNQTTDKESKLTVASATMPKVEIFALDTDDGGYHRYTKVNGKVHGFDLTVDPQGAVTLRAFDMGKEIDISNAEVKFVYDSEVKPNHYVEYLNDKKFGTEILKYSDDKTVVYIYGQNGLPVCVAKDDDFKIANQTDGANDKGPNALCNRDELYTRIINSKATDSISSQENTDKKEVPLQTKATKEDTLPKIDLNMLHRATRE